MNKESGGIEVRNLRIVGFFGSIMKESMWGFLPTIWSYVPCDTWGIMRTC